MFNRNKRVQQEQTRCLSSLETRSYLTPSLDSLLAILFANCLFQCAKNRFECLFLSFFFFYSAILVAICRFRLYVNHLAVALSCSHSKNEQNKWWKRKEVPRIISSVLTHCIYFMIIMALRFYSKHFDGTRRIIVPINDSFFSKSFVIAVLKPFYYTLSRPVLTK